MSHSVSVCGCVDQSVTNNLFLGSHEINFPGTSSHSLPIMMLMIADDILKSQMSCVGVGVYVRVFVGIADSIASVCYIYVCKCCFYSSLWLTPYEIQIFECHCVWS